MGDDKLAKRTDSQKVDGKRRQGGPKLQWGVALSDLERVGEEWGKDPKIEGM